MRKIYLSMAVAGVLTLSTFYVLLALSISSPYSYTSATQVLSQSPVPVGQVHYDLIVMVPSVGSYKDRRDQIRRQFTRSQKLTSAKALLLFILSDSTTETTNEAGVHHDMIYVACQDSDQRSMPEENSSTTCKVLRGVQHLTQQFTFHFLARIGDDAYFRFDYFWNIVRPTLPSGPLYMGRFLADETVWEPHLQNHLWLKKYPPYASGMGYVFSHEAAQYIGEASRITEFRTGYPEDAVVGLWLIGTVTIRLHSDRFHNLPDQLGGNTCNSDSILIHYMTPALWDAIDNQGKLSC